MRYENPKLYTLEQLVAHRASLREAGKRVVITNGCFDLVHPGHVSYLRQARALGDALFIGLNSDASVRALKGDTRPVVDEQARAYILAGFEFIDALFIFNTPRLDNELRALAADIYVKAGDYTLDTINKEERAAMESVGTEIRFLPFLEGFSTTELIGKINKAAEAKAI